MEHRLDFLNPTWHYGPNTTVRLGNKWFEKASIGDVVSLYRTGRDKPLVEGKIINTEFKPFLRVTAHDMLDEHDPECRNLSGLVLAMLKAYPDFDLESWVTVIKFII